MEALFKRRPAGLMLLTNEWRSKNWQKLSDNANKVKLLYHGNAFYSKEQRSGFRRTSQMIIKKNILETLFKGQDYSPIQIVQEGIKGYKTFVRLLLRIIGFNLNLKKISHWAIPNYFFHLLTFHFGLNSNILLILTDIKKHKNLKFKQRDYLISPIIRNLSSNFYFIPIMIIGFFYFMPIGSITVFPPSELNCVSVTFTLFPVTDSKIDMATNANGHTASFGFNKEWECFANVHPSM